MTITELVNQCHANAKDKGFWDNPRELGTMIALIHSEVTEALDAGSCAEFCEELADICIRIGDLCGGLGIDLEAVLKEIGQDIEAEHNLSVNTKEIRDIEKTFSSLPPDPNTNSNTEKFACDIHKSLSYALEADRKNDKELFAVNIGWVFMSVFIWAASRGYAIKQNILTKMEKNKTRPRMHGKAY